MSDSTEVNESKEVVIRTPTSNYIKAGFGLGCGCLIFLLVIFVFLPTACTVGTVATVAAVGSAAKSEVQIQPKKSVNEDVQSTSKTSVLSVPVIFSAGNSLSVTSEQVYVMLQRAASRKDFFAMAEGIRLAQKRDMTTVVAELEKSGWIKWYHEQRTMEQNRIKSLSPPPVNISELCSSDQTAFIATYFYYANMFKQCDKSNGTDVQKRLIRQEFDDAISPFLKIELHGWVGKISSVTSFGSETEKPDIHLNSDGTASIDITVTALATDGKQDKAILYTDAYGESRLIECANSGTVHFVGTKIPQSMLPELAKVNRAWQFVRFSGHCVRTQGSSSFVGVNDDVERVLSPQFEFEFTEIKVVE